MAIVQRVSLALLLVAIVTPVRIEAAPVGAPLASMTLRLTDLPRGFRAGVPRFYSNAQSARSYGVSAGTLNRKGRVLSYQQSFGLLGRRYNTVILNGVVAYRSGDGARWEYTRSAVQAPRAFQRSHQFYAPSLQGLGDERFGIALGTRRRGATLYVLVVFRRGDYVASIALNDTTGRFDRQEVIHLAAVLDGRIRKYG